MTELLTLDEAALRLRLSRRTLEREIRAGRLRVERVGPARRMVRVKPAELDAYLAGLRRSA